MKRLPKHQRPTVANVARIAKRYYALPKNSVGGNLHIVLEDWNVKDSDIQHCLDSAKAKKDVPGVCLASLLLKMSKTQRRKVAAAI